MKCEHCKKGLRPLNPPVEEYLEHKFCFNIFGWKLMFLKDDTEYGCPDCLADKRQSSERDDFMDVVNAILNEKRPEGRLISLDD